MGTPGSAGGTGSRHLIHFSLNLETSAGELAEPHVSQWDSGQSLFATSAPTYEGDSTKRRTP